MKIISSPRYVSAQALHSQEALHPQETLAEKVERLKMELAAAQSELREQSGGGPTELAPAPQQGRSSYLENYWGNQST